MGGLLYKDFVSVKGKAASIIIIITVLLFLLFRVIFPGNVYNEFFSARTETGEIVVNGKKSVANRRNRRMFTAAGQLSFLR